MTETVMLEKRPGGIAFIILNRPEAANSLSVQMLQDLSSVLLEVKKDRSIRVVVLTGAGEKVFCAGADLKERREMSDEEAAAAVRKIGATINEVEKLPQPVIAAINGHALGGGLELALACDIRIGALEAKLGLTETSLAIIPGAGGTQRLPRLIGPGKAKELIFTARRLTGQQAMDAGILEYAVPLAELESFALTLAEEMSANGPVALVQAKLAINKGLEVDLMTGLHIEQMAYNALIQTNDRREGLEAFADKRKPVYKGE